MAGVEALDRLTPLRGPPCSDEAPQSSTRATASLAA